MIVDPEADVFRWLASWHDPAVAVAEFEEAAVAGLSRVVSGCRATSGRTGRPLVQRSRQRVFRRNELAARAGLRSGFGFPIKLGEEVFGVMEFFTRDPQTEDPTLLEVMNSIGNHIGQFIERKHAEEQREQIFAREQRARLELETAMKRMRQVQTVTEVPSHICRWTSYSRNCSSAYANRWTWTRW